MPSPITGAQNITVDFFRAIFDEFATVPVAKIEAFIVLASARVSLNAWGKAGGIATAYLTAHMLATSGGAAGTATGTGGASGGALTQEAVGDLSRSFGAVGVPGSGKETYMTTRYGQTFVELMRENITGYSVTGCPNPLPGTFVP